MAHTAIRLGYISTSGGGGGIVEYANLAAFPAIGVSSLVYLALDTKKIYKWSSGSYLLISPSEVVSVNTKVGAVVLDKTDVGLGNVDNTSDANKPISSATQTALNAKEDTSNKSTTTTLGTSDTLYPSQNAVKTYVDTTVNKFRAEFVFQPGGTAQGNVYTSWALLHSALVATPGSKIIFFDDNFGSCVIPSGDYNFTNTVLSANIYNDVGAYVIISSGVEFNGLGEVENLFLEFQNIGTVQSFFGENTINFRNCIIKSSGTSAPFEFEGTYLLVNLQENAVFQNNGAPVFRSTSTADLVFNAYSNSSIESNTVSSISGSFVGFNTVDPSAVISQTQSGILGSVTYTNKSESDKINYPPTTPANWSTVPSNVKQGLDTLASSKVNTSSVGAINGVASLDGTGKVPSTQLPSYVDDVLEFANLAAFPATGATGIIYVALDTNKCYRWSGSAYVEISASEVNSVAGKTGVVLLVKADVGLSNVDNTSDANKPISSATQTALNGKANLVHNHALSDLTQSAATNGQVPSWNGTNWVPSTPATVITDHTLLTNIGTNTHANIDSHIAASANVHGVGVGNSIVGTGTTQALTNKTIDAASNTISNIANANVSATAAIAYSKLALSNSIVNADVATAAAVARTKLASGTANHVLINDGTGVMSSEAALAASRGGLGTSGAAFTGVVKAAAGVFSAATVVNADVSATAAIARTKLASGTANRIIVNDGTGVMTDAAAITASRALISDASGIPTASTVTSATLAFLDATSSVQTQINSKQNTITGAATTITSADLTISRAVVSDATGKIVVSAATATEVGYLSGVTSAIQTQINSKQNSLGFTPEDVANKSTATTLGVSDTLYPTQNAVKTYVDNAVTGGATPDATTLVKGKVKLAGDLAGTADLPTVPGLATKEPTITATTAADYYRGDKTFQPLNKTAVGLSNVDNTSDANKPISSATQTALNAKQDTITGAASTVTSTNLTASRAVVSDISGKISASSVTSTEVGYLSGVTSAIQTQINGKANTAHVHALSDLTQSAATSGQVPSWNGTNWVPVTPSPGVTDHTLLSNIGTNTHAQIDAFMANTNSIYTDTKEPTGFLDRTQSTLAFVDGTRTLSITPAISSFTIYIRGVKYVKSAAETYQIPNLPGNHYIYYNSSGSLTSTQTITADLFRDNAMVSIVYWNTDTSTHTYFAEERHGIQMDGETHAYFHTVFGARYLTGLALQGFVADGDGSLNTQAQFTSDSGTIRDEDIIHTLTAQTQIPVYYRQGQLWRRKAPDGFPFIYSGTVGYTGAAGRIPYNEYNGTSWQLTQIANNGFVLIHLFATNDIDDKVVAIQGTNTYGNVTAARVAATSEITALSGLPFAEFVAIGSVVLESANAFTNTPKAIVRSSNGGNYVDFRGTQLYTPAGTATTHSLLSGLSNDDHIQYHTDARGDIRYYTKTQVDSIISSITSPGDLDDTAFSFANNQAVAANVTGFAFANATVRSFKALVSVSVNATTSLFEVFEIEGIQKGSEWDYSIASKGDITGLSFSITNAGQIQYTSPSFAGFVSGTIKFRALTTAI